MAGQHRLEDQAAATALNAHKDQRRPSVLDDDGKLSSASAALSLKYAQPQDLPSFPSAGLKFSSAGAAASLADSNKKNFEHWKPGAIPAANRAAMLAKDYEMDPLWQPELSTAGSKAALLAHRDPQKIEIWKSQGTEDGQSAAGQALKIKSPNAITERDGTADGRHKALLAATGAMAGRPRSDSAPVRKGDSTNWALKAATSSQRGAPNMGPFTSGDPGFEAARIQNMAKNNVNRNLYGSTPPVAIEVEEKNRQDTLRASAVAMARKMYAIQQSHIDEAAGVTRGDSHAAANSSHRRNLSDSANASDQVAAPAPRYENLEEAARRLAQERLAKMHDEHAEYRQYYGASTAAPRSRLSVRLGRRASTGGRDDDSDDEEQSRRIRSQMSMFQSKVADVDKKKQQADRNALLEAAHRNVEARMAKMDQEVFQQTGKASPAQKELWEQQARERAQKTVDETFKNHGKVHIGGGKYLEQSEIDAIAKARLQPTLDEIHDNAERMRARDEEIRLEQQRAQDQLAKEKARDAEAKAEIKASLEQEKLEARKKKAEEKEASKHQAAVEKERLRKIKEEKQAAAAEEKEKARLEKEQQKAEEAAEKDKRKSAEVKPGRFNSILKKRNKETGTTEAGPTTATTTAATTTATTATSETTTEPVMVTALEGDTVHDQVTRPQPVGSDRSSTGSAKYEDTVTGITPNTVAATAPSTSVVSTTTPATTSTTPAATSTTTHTTVSTTVPTVERPAATAPTTKSAAPLSPEEPTSPKKTDSKVKSWFKTHLKGSSKAPKDEPSSAVKTAPNEDVDQTRDESIRDVALAGRETEDFYGPGSRDDRPISPIRETEAEGARASRASSISSYSSQDASVVEARPLSGVEHTAQVAVSGLKPKVVKKSTGNKEEPGLPTRESFVTATTTTSEDSDEEEARDKVDDKDRALAPSTSLTAHSTTSPRASHEQSKFKEDL